MNAQSRKNFRYTVEKQSKINQMKFNLSKSIEILERTPSVLLAMLSGISDDWIFNNEGDKSWNVCEVIVHLIQAEKTNWIPRLEIILSADVNKTFATFDRYGLMDETKEMPFDELLKEFKVLRRKSLKQLQQKNISEKELGFTATHPVFGEVSLAQLLATWTVHDLNHLTQISRIMAKQYKEEVGPWIEYLRILK